MTTPRLQVHQGGHTPLFTAADLELELNPSLEQLVGLARADVASDLGLLGAEDSDLPPLLVRRLVGLRAMWRRYVIDQSANVIVVDGDYRRLLDEADLYLELNVRNRGRTPARARASKSH